MSKSIKPKPTIAVALTNSLNVKGLTSPSNKKVEGFDKTTSSLFASKVSKLKARPKVEGLEEQYINGLQEEIKYLELQLKLLQEKQQERHGQIDQLEKFFGDGIPINENILALKNGFNNTKNSKEQQILSLTQQHQERSTLINQLAVRSSQLNNQLAQQQQQRQQTQLEQQKQWLEQVYQQAALKRELQRQEQELKSVKLESRKISQKVEKVTRSKLIESITIIKHENSKLSKLEGLRQVVSEKEAEVIELREELNKLMKQQQGKNFLLTLEEKNLSQKRKAIALEREYDALKSKIKEKQVQLEQKLRERMTEINSKAEIKAKVEALREQINDANSVTVQVVSGLARQKEVQRLRRILDANRKLAKYIDHYSQVLASVQSSIENLAQRKPEAKSELQITQKQVARLGQRLKEERARQVALFASGIQTQECSCELRGRVGPMQERSRKANQQATGYLQERRRLCQEIKVKQKQLQLVFVLRNLSFQEAEMSKNSNSSVQEELLHFLKNWEKIQRTP